MGSEFLGLLLFLVLFILLFAGMPIGFALALIGFIGLIFCFGIDMAFSQLGMVPFSSVADYSLSVVPLFMLAGILASKTGIINGIYNAAYKWLGPLPGGLAVTSIPIVFPITSSIGIDPILFGTLFVIVMEMSLVTPPHWHECLRHARDDR